MAKWLEQRLKFQNLHTSEPGEVPMALILQRGSELLGKGRFVQDKGWSRSLLV